MNSSLFLEIEEFYSKLQNGHYDYLPALATRLQQLADKAWDQLEELYQPSIKIDP